MHAPATADTGPPPAWLTGPPARPSVYATLGTVFNLESGDLFARLLAGLRDLDLDLIVTVGTDIDPAELGPQPPHVHVERFLPPAWVLPRATVVVSHGGSGTLAAALVHGLPQVIVPMGADQPGNADRAAALGLARVLDPVTATPAAIRDAARTVLTDPSYRSAARRLQAETLALPGPDSAVPLLARLPYRSG